MPGVNYLTQEGYDSLIAARDAAKKAWENLDAQIRELEGVLTNSSVLEKGKLDASKVSVLSDVVIKNTKTEVEATYKLVFENEADLKHGKISVTSSMGTGLLGKEIGDIVNVETPRGNLEFEIVDISI